MNILIATSEAVPFAKTGGLADVCGALPVEVSKLGHSTAVIMPAYRQVWTSGMPIEELPIQFSVPIGTRMVSGRLLRSKFPDSDVPVYLVEQPEYFDRPQLYREEGIDYRDNCERYVFFSRAVMETIRLLDLKVDVLHCNDWQTGLIPAYLRIEYRQRPGYEHIGTLLTIHNLAYQGLFWHWDMLLTGLDWKHFNWQQMEFFGNLSLLKTGLVFADRLNTVSPRYAEEIQSAPLGCGLEGVLQQRRGVLSGIINGVDYRHWNPQTDPHLPLPYGPENVRQGKAAAKAALQKELELTVDPNVPLIGLVGRLVDQKGIDLVAAVLRDWAQYRDVQWAILGTGDPQYHEAFTSLAKRAPRKVAVRLEFSDALAHRIEGGADIFLMPSRYEPCGLNQLYSLKYGAVPLVRATGGLADTVTDSTDESLAAQTATGFSFREYSGLALSETLDRAIKTLAKPAVWPVRLMTTGCMRQDWSWAHVPQQYVALYEQTAAAAR